MPKLSRAAHWDGVDSDDLEELTFHLVSLLGFDEPVRWSGSGDRGVDIRAYEAVSFRELTVPRRQWIFQSKHVHKLTKRDVEVELANFAAAPPDTWVAVTTARATPEFRRWLESLDTGTRYPFHVLAWWREDLERLVRRFSDELRRRLPQSLIPVIERVAATAPPTNQQQALTTAARGFSNRQIDRFARHKFIAGLYIDRTLQADVVRFLDPERVVADTAQTNARALIAQAQLSFERGILDTTTERANIERARARVQKQGKSSSGRSHKDGLARIERWLEHRRLVWEGSGSWREAIPALFAEATSQLRRLPKGKYIGKASNYEQAAVALHALREHLRKMPNWRGPRSIDDVERNDTDIGPISLERTTEYLEVLRRAHDSIVGLEKHGFLVVDRAGGGKTNLTCHLATSCGQRHPFILLFGRDQFSGPQALVERVTEIVVQGLGCAPGDAVHRLDTCLEADGVFLTICIDGINEARDIATFDAAIAQLLAWACGHRIKVVLTCRDIYWEYFNRAEWSHHLQRIVRDELKEFSAAEYNSALPLYLDHYHLKCELAEDAQRACRHPLLLRFFCEAYGSTDGDVRELGRISDIRLKELFDTYIVNKTEQVRLALGHRDSAAVRRYLYRLVGYMFGRAVTNVSSLELGAATGDEATSTYDSLYVKLLDEDIIIEERPGDTTDERRVSFVYEEFMEFLLARSMLTGDRDARPIALEVFAALDQQLAKWVNARGVGEYVALMLMAGDVDRSRGEALVFLREMATASDVWRRAFWSVIGKCDEKHLRADLFDLFPTALKGIGVNDLQGTLGALRRYSPAAARHLAGVILWSAALPNVISWQDLESIRANDRDVVQATATRLRDLTRSSYRTKAPSDIATGPLLGAVWGFIDNDSRVEMQKAARSHGMPKGVGARLVSLVRLFGKAFPDFQPLFLNGLFHEDEEVRCACADRLRLAKEAHRAITTLSLAVLKGEPGEPVGQFLSRISPRAAKS
jgi:hypothetical protein